MGKSTKLTQVKNLPIKLKRLSKINAINSLVLMKKIVILVIAASFIGTFLTSCGQDRCTGVTTQVEKVKVSESDRPL